MNRDDVKKLKAIAEQFGFSDSELALALMSGQRAHDLAEDSPIKRDTLKAIAESSAESASQWNTLSRDVQDTVGYQMYENGPSYPALFDYVLSKHGCDPADEFRTHITGVLNELPQLLHEVSEYFDSILGGGSQQQQPGLNAFAPHIKKLWERRKRGKFGRGVTGDKDNKKITDQGRFMFACAQWLDTKYTEANCRTVMKNAEEKRKPRLVTEDPEPTHAEIVNSRLHQWER